MLDTFEWKVLTAYTHIVITHTLPLMKKWGNICKYSQQGLELANKVQKQISKKATNHSKSAAVIQQFNHVYRRIYYEEMLPH